MEFDTALGASGLIPKNLIVDAELAVFAHYEDEEARDYFLEDIRASFFSSLDAEEHDKAAALVYAALTYAYKPKAKFDLLYLQGVALTKMIEAGGPASLHDFRIAAFENAMLALEQDPNWPLDEMRGRIERARAWQAGYGGKPDPDTLSGACEEYAALIPPLSEGRLGYAQHAKAAELAA